MKKAGKYTKLLRTLRYKIILSITFSIALINNALSQDETLLLRFPTIMNEQIVFSYAGDLYTINLNSDSIARRLTSHDGYEMFAKISPNGKYIAFTGQYDGNTEVYIIDANGDNLKRLTYTATLSRDDVSDRMGPNNIVMCWTTDSKNVVYRSRCYSFNDFIGKLFMVSIQGEMPVEMPFDEGGFCSFSQDDKMIAFNKVFREFRSWKYYKGGMADDIWIYDYPSKKAVKIFENESQDIFPMWYQDKIFFISDRDRIMNLFMYDTQTMNVTKMTNFTEYDIKFPSIGDDKIIFENAGALHYYDITNNKTERITVKIKNDFTQARSKIVDATEYITNYDIAPKGERLVFAARGDIFTVPTKSGVTKNLTKSSESHQREVKWSPNGEYVVYLSDASSEFEIYIQKQDGTETPIQITDKADTYYFKLEWSPDSKKILFYDKKLNLQYVDITTKQKTIVATSDKGEITNFAWAPDSRWIAFALPNQDTYDKICLYNIDNKITTQVTDGWYHSGSPRFSPCGKYLYFTSNRYFKPIYSDLEWNTAYKDMTNIYIVTLHKNTPSPIAQKNDVVNSTNADSTKINLASGINIELDGIENRIVQLTDVASNYYNLITAKDRIYYSRQSFNDSYSTTYYFDFKENKEILLAKNLHLTLSHSQNKMLIYNKSTKKYSVMEMPLNEIINTEQTINLQDMTVNVDYQKEWKQIYDETWRQMRDFFYDPNMHGVNWKDIHTKYAVLLPYVKHRYDLTYLMSEMIAELNVGHAYVGGGDATEIDKIYMGLLGAKFEKDKNTGYFKITKILKGANWSKNLRSPLTEIGVNIKEGDYIIAINGVSTNTVNNIYELLINTADRQTELLHNSTASDKGATLTIVTPIKDEAELYYYNWVETNLDKVTKATDGKIGYLHIPDMSAAGLNEFVEYFYPQLNKQGLIIDDRGNGGGNVSPMIIERLKRELVFYNISRNVPKPTTKPVEMIVGPKVMLINEYSASDGDLFPYQFKYYKMGTIIGKRSWGGVVGIRGSLNFVDGGNLRKPEFAPYSVDGKEWIIEGYGVEPDITIENNPVEVINQNDEQLNKAIEIILKQLETTDTEKKSPPPYKNKSE